MQHAYSGHKCNLTCSTNRFQYYKLHLLAMGTDFDDSQYMKIEFSNLEYVENHWQTKQARIHIWTENAIPKQQIAINWSLNSKSRECSGRTQAAKKKKKKKKKKIWENSMHAQWTVNGKWMRFIFYGVFLKVKPFDSEKPSRNEVVELTTLNPVGKNTYILYSFIAISNTLYRMNVCLCVLFQFRKHSK